MDVNSQKINDILKTYLSDVQQFINIEKAILYGSYAKGNYNEYSDIDIAIFSDSFKNKNSIEINSFLFSLARKYKEFCIEPIGFDLTEDNPFIREIMDTGKEIYLQ